MGAPTGGLSAGQGGAVQCKIALGGVSGAQGVNECGFAQGGGSPAYPSAHLRTD